MGSLFKFFQKKKAQPEPEKQPDTHEEQLDREMFASR